MPFSFSRGEKFEGKIGIYVADEKIAFFRNLSLIHFRFWKIHFDVEKIAQTYTYGVLRPDFLGFEPFFDVKMVLKKGRVAKRDPDWEWVDEWESTGFVVGWKNTKKCQNS